MMTFMKSKLLKIFIWIPAVICAVMIFGFSGQNGENSGNLSRKAAGIIVDIADSVHLVDVRWNGRQELIDKIELAINTMTALVSTRARAYFFQPMPSF